jgi:hypothetical protein
MRLPIIAALAVGLAAWSAVASADPGKDESGKGRRGGYARYDDGPKHGRYRAAVRIPRGHLPPPGECRRWYAGRPAGHQPPPFRC